MTRTTSAPTAPTLTVPRLALGALLALSLAACTAGGDAEPDASAPAPGTAPTSAPATTEAAAPAQERTPDLESPLMEVFGEAWATLAGMDAEVQRSKHDAYEAALAACLREQGFTYEPEPWTPDPGNVDFSDPAVKAEYGYGVSTDDDPGAPPEEAADDDEGEVQGRSPEEEAFHRALYGPEDPDGTLPLEEQGCAGAAEVEVFGGSSSLLSEPRWAELLGDLMAIYAPVESDPRLLEVQQAWSECMAQAGHPGLADARAAKEMLQTEWEDMWAGRPQVGEHPGLAALRQRELALAGADLACAEDVGLDRVRRQLEHEAERAFVDARRAELEEMGAAMAEQNALFHQD